VVRTSSRAVAHRALHACAAGVKERVSAEERPSIWRRSIDIDSVFTSFSRIRGAGGDESQCEPLLPEVGSISTVSPLITPAFFHRADHRRARYGPSRSPRDTYIFQLGDMFGAPVLLRQFAQAQNRCIADRLTNAARKHGPRPGTCTALAVRRCLMIGLRWAAMGEGFKGFG